MWCACVASSFVADQPITFLVRHRVSDDKVPAFLLFVEAIAKVSISPPCMR